MSRTKEETYDELIYPLMAEIIRLCKNAGINMYGSFKLDDDDLVCTTFLGTREESGEWYDTHLQAARNEGAFPATTTTVITTTRDGSVIDSTVVL